MIAALKYLKQYFHPSAAAVERIDASYERAGRELPAVIYRPTGRRPGRAWIVLHGLTYHGSRHPGLMRFARSLAASNHLVFIPEILEWTQLHFAPELAAPTIHAAVEVLRGRHDVEADRIGVFGFSFGATQALVAATDQELASRLKAIVAWGGYADIARLVHFAMTGEHEIDGVREYIDPDPYGRWIFGANYLTQLPGYENRTRPAKALMQLAREAGRSGRFAGDPVHNTLKAELASKLDRDDRRIYELFAPQGPFDVEAARELGDAFADAVVQMNLMDPRPVLDRVQVPAIITHGRDDRLIPYTESIRLKRLLPPDRVADFTVTALFSHSGGTQMQLGPLGLARESARFAAILNRILTAL